MSEMKAEHHLLLFLGALQFFFLHAAPQSFIGINYGEVADNLPPPSATARLLQSTTITKVRMYGTDPAMITALAGTTVSLLLGAANGDIPSLASSVSAAAAWASSNLPASSSSPAINAVSVGNEVFSYADATISSQLLPAMQNLHAALPPNSTTKISTVHSMAVLSSSDPPSSGAFHPDLDSALDPILQFLHNTSSPFMINPYPYFAYLSDTRPDTLAFCLFQPNPGRPDANSKLTYMNMFDAQLDAIRAALDAKGYPDVEIVVAETGWPHKGDPDEAGATAANAQAYVDNLLAHLRSLAGTPRVPGKSVDTYLFAMYDEDLKPGPTSERSFGLFGVDLAQNYDTQLLSNASVATAPAPAVAPLPSPAEVSPAPVVPGKGQGSSTATQVQPQNQPSPSAAAGPAARCLPGTAQRGTAGGRTIQQPGGGCFIPSLAVADHVLYPAASVVISIFVSCSLLALQLSA